MSWFGFSNMRAGPIKDLQVLAPVLPDGSGIIAPDHPKPRRYMILPGRGSAG